MMTSRILLLEDDPSHQCLLRMAISQAIENCRITIAQNREEFRQVINSNTFDCVVADFNLSGCQANELLSELKTSAPDCPAIVVSSSHEQSVVIESLRSGGVDFILKEEIFTSDILQKRVRAVLDENRRREGERRRADRRKNELLQMAIRDHLTGLYNRRYADELLKRLSNQSISPQGNACIAMIDVDHFKHLNDAYGHLEGDRILQNIAGQIRSGCRDADVACRWGGEEFIVIKLNCEPAHGWCWAERLRKQIASSLIDVDSHQVPVSISVGFVNVPNSGISADAVKKADEALYLAKKNGRDCVIPHEVVVFSRLVQEASGGSIDERLSRVLTLAASGLGPTQLEHLREHSRDVSQFAVKLARSMKLSDDRIESVRVAALCHDLGKFAIPESVLAKSAPLSSEEEHLLARHPQFGAELALMLGLDEKTANLIRKSSRRFCAASQASSVPLDARILQVADALVTMRTDRPYRKALSPSATIREIRRQTGRQFDRSVSTTACRLACESKDLVGAF